MNVNQGRHGDDFTAYCLDRAVWLFGASVEQDMDDAEKACGEKASEIQRTLARQRIFDSYMKIDGAGGTTIRKGQFADPMRR